MEVQGIWDEKDEILKSSVAIWGIIENRGLGGGGHLNDVGFIPNQFLM